ncbi:MAG: hypothetical protein ACKO2H_12310, partial [Bacteroidota bacterium]
TYLRTYLESRPCVTAATKPVIRMIYPWGQQTLIIGEQTNIEWTSYRVNNVNIEMSTDGGITWRTIFVSRPAVTQANGTGLFKWTIPDNPTTKGRLRIIDASNDQVKDTSWADFAIAKPTLTLNTDLRTKKYGQKERVNLSWTKELIDKTFCSSKNLWYHGLKLHVLGFHRLGTLPYPEQMLVTPASTNDLNVFK